MPQHEIVLKSVEPVWIASAREIVDSPELMRERCIALIDEVESLLHHANLPNNGVTLALYHQHNGRETAIDVEMAYFLEGAVRQSAKFGKAQIRQLPAEEMMATAVYRGSYNAFDAVGQLHLEIVRWIEANGYRITGPNRELYLQVPRPFDGEGVTEVQYPVAKAG